MAAAAAVAATRSIHLKDGRILGYAEYGHPAGPPLLYFHGHPGSRVEAGFLAAPAAAVGARLIGLDRPGLGVSTFAPKRRLLDWPDDVVELADQLQLGRFGVVGFSGGGPYALACAYRLADRLTACGVVAGVGRLSPLLAFLSQWLPWLILPLTASFFRDEGQAQNTLLRFARNWPAPDQEALRAPGITEVMAASLVEALRPGTRGAAYDGVLLGRAWGFRLEDLAFPNVYWWHGELDQEVAVAAGRASARRLAHCQAKFFPDEGHISLIVNRAAEIVKALV